MAVNSVQSTRLEKTKKKSVKTGCILILLAFCFVLLVFSACLLTVLVLIGKSIVAESNNTNSKLPINRVSEIVHFVNTFMNYHPNQTNQFNRTLFRLPNKNIKPITYDLYLNPNLETGNFSGNVKISLNISEVTTAIYFHGKHLNIFDPELFKNDSINNTLDNIRIKALKENVNSEMWIVTTETNLTPGNYELVLNFTGTMSNKIVGFYKSDYYNSKLNETRAMATSKFEPTYARQAFPCFDEPGMKAVYNVKLAVPKIDNYFALSNMDESKKIDEDDATIYHFTESVKMSTYLTCFIVSDFGKNEGKFISDGKDIPFTVYSSPDNVGKTDFARDIGISIITFYTTYFNIPYPLPKLDLAAIPDFSSGAMETWGLVTFREARLLYEEKTSSIQDKQGIALVVAHELAHMWFGNLVTMKWWNDLWLNEGFATFIEYIGVNEKYPEWQMLDQFLISELHTAFRADSKLTSHPIVQTVDTPDQITAIFDTISYSKGSSILRMLQGFMDLNGAQSFQNGITAYLNKHKFENTETQDLWNALGERYEPMNITKVMGTWTEQMGFPVVNVVRDKNHYTLTQERFLIDSDYDESDVVSSKYNYKWTIPVTYITCKSGTCDKTTTLKWFPYTEKALNIDIAEDVDIVKFNSEQIGYYRVNYDDETWATFSKNMKVFSVSDQASLLDDAFNLAKAQKLKYSIALELSTYLKDSMDYVPWSVGATNLNDLDTYLAGSQSYVKYRAYIKGLVSKAYTELGWEVKTDSESAIDDQHLKRLLRGRILKLACYFGHSECLKVAGEQFQSWLSDTETVIPHPDVRNIVYYYGMSASGTEDSWNKMWERYLKEEDAQEKKNLISGLSAIREPWLLSRFIDLAWDTNNVRRQDYFTCLSSISANPVGTPLVWDYVRLNWEKFVDEFGLNDRYLGRLIPDITSSFTTKVREMEMKQFFAKYPDAGAGESARKQALETVANNIKWLEKNKKSVDDWLETIDTTEKSVINK